MSTGDIDGLSASEASANVGTKLQLRPLGLPERVWSLRASGLKEMRHQGPLRF